MSAAEDGARRGGGDRRGLALLALLCCPLGVAELQHVADYASSGSIEDWSLFRTGYAKAVFSAEVVVACCGPVLAGVLIDRYGVRRVVDLTMLGWCAFVSVGAVVATPATFRLGAPLADALVPGFVLCAALVHAFEPRRRGLAAAAVLTAYHWSREPPRFLASLVRGAAAGWPDAMFLLVSCGALLTAAWLVASRGPARRGAAERIPTAPSPFPLRDLCAVLAIVFWLEVVLAVIPAPGLDLAALLHGDLSLPGVAAGLTAPAAFLAAAAATDRPTRFGLPPASRRAVLVPAFLAAGVIALSRARSTAPDALPLLAAATVGLLRTAELLALDRAPRRATGLFIGLVLTGRLVAIDYLGPPLRAALPSGAVLGAAGVAGAVSAMILLRPRIAG